jgi:hypothetical protein
MSKQPDIYGRKPTSTSRGKTHDRIMALQHDPAIIPGTAGLLEHPTAGSIAAVMVETHQHVVVHLPVTTRRAHERTFAMIARDLHDHGPGLAVPFADFTIDRFAAHLDWRLAHGFDDPGEMRRTIVHVGKLVSHARDVMQIPSPLTKDQLREVVERRAAQVPPPFGAASTSAELQAAE